MTREIADKIGQINWPETPRATLLDLLQYKQDIADDLIVQMTEKNDYNGVMCMALGLLDHEIIKLKEFLECLPTTK